MECILQSPQDYRYCEIMDINMLIVVIYIIIIIIIYIEALSYRNPPIKVTCGRNEGRSRSEWLEIISSCIVCNTVISGSGGNSHRDRPS